jgi:hypothetical protein
MTKVELPTTHQTSSHLDLGPELGAIFRLGRVGVEHRGRPIWEMKGDEFIRQTGLKFELADHHRVAPHGEHLLALAHDKPSQVYYNVAALGEPASLKIANNAKGKLARLRLSYMPRSGVSVHELYTTIQQRLEQTLGEPYEAKPLDQYGEQSAEWKLSGGVSVSNWIFERFGLLHYLDFSRATSDEG